MSPEIINKIYQYLWEDYQQNSISYQNFTHKSSQEKNVIVKYFFERLNNHLKVYFKKNLTATKIIEICKEVTTKTNLTLISELLIFYKIKAILSNFSEHISNSNEKNVGMTPKSPRSHPNKTGQKSLETSPNPFSKEEQDEFILKSIMSLDLPPIGHSNEFDFMSDAQAESQIISHFNKETNHGSHTLVAEGQKQVPSNCNPEVRQPLPSRVEFPKRSIVESQKTAITVLQKQWVWVKACTNEIYVTDEVFMSKLLYDSRVKIEQRNKQGEPISAFFNTPDGKRVVIEKKNLVVPTKIEISPQAIITSNRTLQVPSVTTNHRTLTGQPKAKSTFFLPQLPIFPASPDVKKGLVIRKTC